MCVSYFIDTDLEGVLNCHVFFSRSFLFFSQSFFCLNFSMFQNFVGDFLSHLLLSFLKKNIIIGPLFAEYQIANHRSFCSSIFFY